MKIAGGVVQDVHDAAEDDVVDLPNVILRVEDVIFSAASSSPFLIAKSLPRGCCRTVAAVRENLHSW